jgi:hypothetical protein
MKLSVCAALIAAALAGCSSGSGGVGGSGPSGPVSPPVSDSRNGNGDSGNPPASTEELPTLATVRGDDVRVSSAIASREHEHFRDRVTATADGAGNFTFRVNDPNIGPYTFTVNVPPNTALGGSREGMDFAFNSMNYAGAGVWARAIDSGAGMILRAGAGAFGVATGRADLPTTGTATYSGTFLGRHSDDGDISIVEASARSLANFGTGIVSFETTGSRSSQRTGMASPHREAAPDLDLVGTMTFQSSGGVRQNSLRGPVSTKSGITGEVRGNFFGPSSATSAPPELGGSVAVSRLDNGVLGGEGQSMIGGFVMKR